MPAEVLESVHSADACTNSVSEMIHGHLPDEGQENVIEDLPADELRESSLPHPLISIVPRQLVKVKTTVNTPGALEEDKKKYSSCNCESCRAKAALPQSEPIMITPYRHNWLISGKHHNQKDTIFDLNECCGIQ